MRQILICCVSWLWDIFYLTYHAPSAVRDAKSKIFLSSWGRDSYVLHSGFNRVRIYHNFCRATEFIHFRLEYPLSRDLNTRVINRSYGILLLHNVLQEKQHIQIVLHILIIFHFLILTNVDTYVVCNIRMCERC